MGIFDGYMVQEEVRRQQEEMRQRYSGLQGTPYDAYGQLGQAQIGQLSQAIRQQAEAQNAKSPVQQPEPNPALLLLGEDE